MKIVNSLCPPSKTMVHIALCMSVCWSVYLESRFLTACETYNKDRLAPKTSTWYPNCIEDLYSAGRGGGQGQDHYRLCCCGRGGGQCLLSQRFQWLYLYRCSCCRMAYSLIIIRRSKQLFPLLYSQMLFYVICNYVCLSHRPVCN